MASFKKIVRKFSSRRGKPQAPTYCLNCGEPSEGNHRCAPVGASFVSCLAPPALAAQPLARHLVRHPARYPARPPGPVCPICGNTSESVEVCTLCGTTFVNLPAPAARSRPRPRPSTPTPNNPSNRRPPPPVISPTLSAPDAHLVRPALEKWDLEFTKEMEGTEDPFAGFFRGELPAGAGSEYPYEVWLAAKEESERLSREAGGEDIRPLEEGIAWNRALREGGGRSTVLRFDASGAPIL